MAICGFESEGDLDKNVLKVQNRNEMFSIHGNRTFK